MTTTPDPVDVAERALVAEYDPDCPDFFFAAAHMDAEAVVAALSEHYILVPSDGPLPDDLLVRAVEQLRCAGLLVGRPRTDVGSVSFWWEDWTPSERTDSDER